MKKEVTKLNPGSPEAVKAGCRCPVIDNHYGKGVPYGDSVEYWMTEECPLHGFKSEHGATAAQGSYMPKVVGSNPTAPTNTRLMRLR